MKYKSDKLDLQMNFFFQIDMNIDGFIFIFHICPYGLTKNINANGLNSLSLYNDFQNFWV